MDDRKLDINGLAAVSFRAEHTSSLIKAWRAVHAVPVAETCSRKVWYGPAEDFESFPHKGARHINLMHGKGAYGFLLKLVSGLESKRRAETHVRSQFYEAWNKFAEQQPQRQRAYRTLISQIRSDVGVLDACALSGFLPVGYPHAACDLAGQKKGDNVLIIGDLSSNEKGEMSGSAGGLIRLSESRQHGRTGFITLTHPDPARLDDARRRLDCLTDKNVVRSGVSVRPFAEIGGMCGQSDTVFMALCLGEYPEADSRLAGAWRERARRDNTLVCMKGAARNSGENAAGFLADANLDHCIPHDRVREEVTRRHVHNEALCREADALAERCAALRAEGRVPRLEIAGPNTAP